MSGSHPSSERKSYRFTPQQESGMWLAVVFVAGAVLEIAYFVVRYWWVHR